MLVGPLFLPNLLLSSIGISGFPYLSSWLGSNLGKNILNFSGRLPSFFLLSLKYPGKNLLSTVQVGQLFVMTGGWGVSLVIPELLAMACWCFSMK